jgi:hypothetical protein
MQNGLFVLDASAALQLNSTPKSSELVIFPNPGNNLLTINFSDYKRGNYEFQIYDISGKSILKNEFNISSSLYQEKINTDNLADGVYFISIKGETTAIQKKWMKITNN